MPTECEDDGQGDDRSQQVGNQKLQVDPIGLFGSLDIVGGPGDDVAAVLVIAVCVGQALGMVEDAAANCSCGQGHALFPNIVKENLIEAEEKHGGEAPGGTPDYPGDVAGDCCIDDRHQPDGDDEVAEHGFQAGSGQTRPVPALSLHHGQEASQCMSFRAPTSCPVRFCSVSEASWAGYSFE